MVPRRGGMPGLRPAAALAGGVRLPAMRSDWGAVGNGTWGVSLPGMCWTESLRPARSSRGRASRCGCGSWRWFVTSQKNGVSALGLRRMLGWVATRQPGRGSTNCAGRWFDPAGMPHGTVEVDETYVGGPEEGKRGREVETKAIVAVAAEKSGRGVGRIRLRRVKDVSGTACAPSSRVPWCPVLVTPTDGTATPGWRRPATSTRSPSSRAGRNRRTRSCRASTWSPRCSSGG